jgi:hypothetical protein
MFVVQTNVKRIIMVLKSIILVMAVLGYVACTAQDSLPPLHTLKSSEISAINPSFEQNTIAVALKNGTVYTYHSIDFDFEDHIPGVDPNVKNAIINMGKTFIKIEHEPEFAGGLEAWNKYIKEFCLRHKQSIEDIGAAEFTIQFTVHMKGQICDVHVLYNRSHSDLVPLALEAIEESPPWTPGIQNGQLQVSYKSQVVKLNL